VRGRAVHAGGFLFVSLQLPLSPMMVFAIGIENALDVTVQRPRHFSEASSFPIGVVLRPANAIERDAGFARAFAQPMFR
jgi:hypothetical protein